MATTALFGLIGYPLGHSFSKRYFTEKFEQIGLADSHAYTQFEIPSIEDYPVLLKTKGIRGFNVTIPYKQQIIPFLDEIDPAAARIGAVNTIKILSDGRTRGYNTDYFGFQQTLKDWSAYSEFKSRKAVVLGQGGAAKAVIAAIEDLGIPVIKVSRKASDEAVSYEALPALMDSIGLIVNTTPLGMHPHEEACPAIPYANLTPQHYLYDIVYNPLETTFLKKGIESGAGGIHTGIQMLYGQADKAWEIWQS
ncbi:shikimate dehydrogenase family protein [Aquirufa sp.]|jgi:shikimate dehydrogenase|uniref:shikimate dehydrogenase family protein n=1 Tax=Aquirufa sp. TaxID=2676249 RepID=UPI0037BEE1ED